MNDLNTPNSNGIPGISVTKHNKSPQFLLKNTPSLPILDLPQELLGYTFYNSRITPPKSQAILLPDVDKTINNYSDEVMPILFTVKFIEIVNQNFPLLILSLNNDKLSFAINLYYKMANLPPMLKDDEIRKTLSVYLGNSPVVEINPIAKTNSNKLNDLKELVKTFEKTYLDKLKKIKYKRGENEVVLDKDANWFIEFANQKIEGYLFNYFLVAKARSLQNLPDAVINDPRFRPSLTDVSWNEYDETIKNQVAIYNQKFKDKPGYTSLDWRLVKAMVWTEILAGPKGNPTQWSKYPLQIGRFSADAGALVVKNGRENSDLITTPNLRKQIQGDITGNNNIKAGIAYLYTRAIRGKGSLPGES